MPGKAPEFAVVPPLPKPPKPMEKPELYSVVVHETPVQDLLFAIARDAKLNVSIQPGISGSVTMSVLDQTLTEILDVIGKQVDLRYELNGKNLTISPDRPFLKIYRIDYPNITRRADSTVSISTNIASTGSGTGGTGSNASNSSIVNQANNMFWVTLVANLREILAQTDPIVDASAAGTAPVAAASTAPAASSATTGRVQVSAPAPSTPGQAGGGGATAGTATPTASPPAASTAPTPPPVASVAAPATSGQAAVGPRSYRETGSVIANPENGIINVRATQRQHEKVREFLDGIMGNARRQVLIEATIVEVDLSDRYQQGIDWSLLRTVGSGTGTGISFAPAGPSTGQLTGGVLSSIVRLAWNKTSWEYSMTTALRLLESFGTLRVLSSPKVSVLNSQTSLLKVVDNEVYFTITVTPGTAATATSAATPATYTSNVNTVPVGFLMSVTPQISGHGEVILNLRPTISRITSFATDPNPDLANAGVVNRIPVVQSREMESILRVQSGDIAVLGGLIQDTRDRKTDGLPGIGNVPVVGDLLKYTDNRSRKTELVIFLRPTVLTDSSLDGDFRQFRANLPEAREAFHQPADRGRPVPGRP
ncbi:MAG: pilus (MSHA type) biogenesis protein MshL [Sulfuritalea sp.]|nr:pilus (MSHA type) biogenesis protein MshL [Sulfuritalea sp.]